MEYDYNDPSTWAVKLRNSDELNESCQINATYNQWKNILNRIPTDIKQILHLGPTMVTRGWAAIELDDEEDPFGDIYYVENDPKNHEAVVKLSHYIVSDRSDTLIFSSSSSWLPR